MVALTWDKSGERFYENGVDRGVLYLQNATTGAYDTGFVWNGITNVTESPSGAEQTPQYADNMKYLNLTSAEEFGATVEAFTYPEKFAECDGTIALIPGLYIGQQTRRPFGLAYRTKVGNDLNAELGYKIHLLYGAQASPSEKSYSTVNDSPEATAFSWTVTTTGVAVPNYKPSATATIDSRLFTATKMKAVEDRLYGTANTEPNLLLPDALRALLAA